MSLIHLGRIKRNLTSFTRDQLLMLRLHWLRDLGRQKIVLYLWFLNNFLSAHLLWIFTLKTPILAWFRTQKWPMSLITTQLSLKCYFIFRLGRIFIRLLLRWLAFRNQICERIGVIFGNHLNFFNNLIWICFSRMLPFKLTFRRFCGKLMRISHCDGSKRTSSFSKLLIQRINNCQFCHIVYTLKRSLHILLHISGTSQFSSIIYGHTKSVWLLPERISQILAASTSLNRLIIKMVVSTILVDFTLLFVASG